MKEYRLGLFIKIFAYALAAGALVGAYFALTAALAADSVKSELLLHLAVLGCLGVAVFMVREIHISKLTISPDRISLVSVIYKRSLALNEIRGWREGKDELLVIPNDDSLKKIPITTYFKDSDEIRYFLISQYPNLDLEEAEAEEEEILQDEALGDDREARALTLEKARKAARYTEWLGWAIALWLFLYPTPYTPSICAGIVFPFLAIGVCFRYPGLIRGGGNNNEKYPSVVGSFVMVSIMLALRGLQDFNILDYSSGWGLMISVAIIVFSLYVTATSRFRFKKKSEYVTIFLLPIFTFAYGYGTVIMINALGDRATPTQYQTEVVAMRISSGKSRTHYLKLRRWGDLKEDEEITVSGSMYDNTNVGDELILNQYPGALGMSWVVVE